MSVATLSLPASTGTMPMLTPTCSALSRHEKRNAAIASRSDSAISVAACQRVIGQQHRELVAAEPRERAGLRHARAQHVAELAQQQVAGAVAAGVVDDLELVEIHVEQRRRLAGLAPCTAASTVGQALFELAPIDEPRQRIVAREIREPAVQLPLLAHVVEHHHGADDLAVAVLDRRRRVLNRDRRAVARDEHDVVGERDDAAFLQAARDGVRDGFAGRLVAQADDRLDRRALRFARLPPRELLGDGVQVLDVAARIGRHDRVADRLQRHLRALLLVEQRALGGLALRDVGDRAFEVQRAAVGRRSRRREFSMTMMTRPDARRS